MSGVEITREGRAGGKGGHVFIVVAYAWGGGRLNVCWRQPGRTANPLDYDPLIMIRLWGSYKGRKG